MKDFTRSIPEPKPKTTTVATKRMIDKDFVAYIEFGNPENTIHWLKNTISLNTSTD
jgi:hypothetical protein